mmetsp:Transcript_13492/g.31740  ORF Transcript_13492/g.31740 Transcript_13492/m.31740 type:complete len:211 (-) Transcript_13492:167-799(-)
MRGKAPFGLLMEACTKASGPEGGRKAEAGTGSEMEAPTKESGVLANTTVRECIGRQMVACTAASMSTASGLAAVSIGFRMAVCTEVIGMVESSTARAYFGLSAVVFTMEAGAWAKGLAMARIGFLMVLPRLGNMLLMPEILEASTGLQMDEYKSQTARKRVFVGAPTDLWLGALSALLGPTWSTKASLRQRQRASRRSSVCRRNLPQKRR